MKMGNRADHFSKDLHSDVLPYVPKLSQFTSLGGILWMTHPPFRLVIFLKNMHLIK